MLRSTPQLYLVSLLSQTLPAFVVAYKLDLLLPCQYATTEPRWIMFVHRDFVAHLLNFAIGANLELSWAVCL